MRRDHRDRRLAVVLSAALLVAMQAQQTQSAYAASPATPASSSTSSAAPQTPPQQPAASKLDASGLPKIETRDSHFDPSRSKELPSLDPRVRQFDNPDGSHTARIGAGALEGLDASGARGSLDLTLVTASDGRLRPRRSVTPISIAATSGPRMASVELAPGQAVDLSPDGVRSGVIPARTPSPSGETVHFDSALANGTGFELRPLSSGVETGYLVASAAAAGGLVERLALPAGYRVRQAGGGIEILDGTGTVVGRWTGGTATDASPNGAVARVTLQLQRAPGGQAAARVVVDAGWLADQARRYPITIDPQVVRESSAQVGFGATYVDTQDANSHWNTSDLHMGKVFGVSAVTRTLIMFPLDAIPAHARIVGATMSIDESWSPSCTPRPMEAHRIGAVWPPNVSWGTQPGFNAGAESSINVASGFSASCPESWQQMDLSALVADWYYGNLGKNGVLLKAPDETDDLAWKRFRGSSTGTPPLLDVTYETYGTNPIAINDGDTMPPVNAPGGGGWQGMTLTNQGTDTWPANGPYQVSYHLYKSDGTPLRDGVQTLIPQTVAPGQSVTLRANIESLPMGDYIVAWDMVQSGVAFFSAFGGVTPVNRSYHSDQPPTVPTLVQPQSGLKLVSVTPTLVASSTDPDGPHLQYLFRICTGSDAESGACADSGWIDASTWQVPRGVLTWGTTYYWHAWARDNFPNAANPHPASVVPGGPPFSYTPQLPITQPEWAFGTDPYVNYQGGVNTALGNYVYSTTDFSIPTVGPPLQVVRTYNSMDADQGLGLRPPSAGGGTYGFGKWFGVGWSSTYETNMIFDQVGNAQVDYPDGRREFLIAQPDGSYQPAFGFVSNVTPIIVLSGGQSRVIAYDLRHRDQSVWEFTPDGRLSSITDPYGRKVQLSWTVGPGHCCTSVTITDQTSGRSLTAFFSAPADQFGRVTSIVSSPVTVNGVQQQLKWTYGYDLNRQLASACDPSGPCTSYTNAGPANQLTGIKRPNGNTVLGLTYDGSSRVATLIDGVGSATNYFYQSVPAAGAPVGSTKTTAVTDALGRTVQSSYNQMNQLLQRVNEDGTSRSYTYDQIGFLNSVVDENGHKTGYANDGASNVMQSIDGAGGIAYRQYDAQNHLTAVRDPRSASPTDITFQTSYTYDAAGNLAKETSPAGTRTWAYSFGTEAAFGGGTVPANLILSATDAMGHATTYAYDAQGNLRRRADPSGLVTELTYDELGRQVSRKETSDSFPNGLITTTSYDLAGHATVVTEPGVTNTVTAAVHQHTTTNAYDGNGNLTSTTVSDASLGDAARKTSYGYDADDRQVTITNALGGTGTTTYDALGNVTQVKDALGRVTATSYTARNQPLQVKLVGFVDGGGVTRDLTKTTYAYDAAGRKTSQTDALGRQVRYGYDNADRLVSTTLAGYHNRDGTTRDIVLEQRAYDPAGNLTSLVQGGGLRTTTSTYDPAGRLATSAVQVSLGVTRTTTYGYDANGNVLSRTVSDGARTEQVLSHYDLDQGARQDRVTVANGVAGDVVTTRTYDQRSLVTSTVDPRGNAAGASAAAFTTSYRYDEAGRLASTTGPTVAVESGGSMPASLQSTETTGYDTFGDLTHTVDTRANVTTTSYDLLGRATGVSYPNYVTPGGTMVNARESWGYDAVGNRTSWTDRRGQVTTYTYDMLNRLVGRTDPKLTGQVAAGVTTFAYDDAGNRTLLKNQVGAQRSFTYDDLNRPRTSSQIVTLPTNPPSAAVYTTTLDYDDLGDRVYQATPLGEVTAAQYNAMGELTQVTDATGQITRTTRDVAGRPVQVTDPLGRTTLSAYDLAGRMTQQQRTDALGKVLASSSFQYDPAGNVLAITDPLGHMTTYAYDALSQQVQLTQPVSSTASVSAGFGYDAAGNRTRVTDGNGRATVMTFNAWNLLETRVLPSTQANPLPGDRTWTWTYDAGGLPVTEAQPGVTIGSTYDELGRIVGRVGTVGSTSTSTTYGYDLAGRMISAGGTAGAQTFTYDERGLVTAASGVAGSSSLSYDGDGQLVSRTDAAGRATFGWNARGDLVSISEPLTGVQETVGYDAAGQLTHIGYGVGGPTRDYGYDGLGQMTSDAIKTGSGAIVAQAGYTYDANGNLRQRQLTTASGTSTDTYDYDFANRLTSWTNPPGTATAYGWDGAGNRIQTGANTYMFDERNRLLSGSGVTYTWSANGNLVGEANSTATTTYSYDGLNRMISAQQTFLAPLSGGSSTTYAYDGLDRVAQRNGVAMSYGGLGQDPVADASFRYSQGPAGEVLGVSGGGATLLAAQDRHGDLAFTFDPSGNTKGTFTYDPFGAVIPHFSFGQRVTPPNLGFQGQWTDPTTGKVLMGARWYDGGTGRFLTQDVLQPLVTDPVDTNLYAYGRANPLLYQDPSGYCPSVFGVQLICLTDVQSWWNQHFGGRQSGSLEDSIQALERILGRTAARQQTEDPWPWPAPDPCCDTPPGGGEGPGDDGGGVWALPVRWPTGHPPHSVPSGQRHLPPPPLKPTIPDEVFLPIGVKAPTGGPTLPPVTDPRPTPGGGCTGGCTPLMGGPIGALLPGPFAVGGTPGDPLGSQCGNPLMRQDDPSGALCKQLMSKARNLVQWVAAHPEESLLLCGMVPVVGAFCNAGLAVMHASRGDWRSALLFAGAAAASLIPGEGEEADLAINGPRLARLGGHSMPLAGPLADVTDATRIPVLGRMPDTEKFIGRPGYDVLKIPTQSLHGAYSRWTPEENEAWIESHIARGLPFRLASPATIANIRGESEDFLISVFGRELRQLWNAGYRESADGRWMLPPPR